MKFTIPYENAFNKPMLPGGSQILINSVSVENATTIYSAVGVTEACVNANTTVNISLGLISVSKAGYMVNMQSPISAPIEKNVNISTVVNFTRNISDGGIDLTAKMANLVITSSGSTLSIQNEVGFNFPSFWGSTIEIQSQNVVLGGVTYALQNETFSYSNLNTNFEELVIGDDFVLAYAMVNGKYKFKPYARIGSYEGNSAIFNVLGSEISGEFKATTSNGTSITMYITETVEKTQNGYSGWLYIPLTPQYKGNFDALPTISSLEQIDTVNWANVSTNIEISYDGLTLIQPITFEPAGDCAVRVMEESTI